MSEDKALRLNLGSGSVRIPGFTNVDFNAGEDVDVVANVMALPYFDSTVSEIFASHILEHFSYDAPVLNEWVRVLKPGGLITVIVPDPIATYYAWKHNCATWGVEAHPVDLQYFNACCFGGNTLGPKWDSPGQYHHQVFIFDMLVERLRPMFPDAAQVDRPVINGMCYESWLCETAVQGHCAKDKWVVMEEVA